MIYLVRIEDEVKLADVFETFVKHFDKYLYQIQDGQLRLSLVDHEDEDQRRIDPNAGSSLKGTLPEDDFVRWEHGEAIVEEVAVVFAARGGFECKFLDEGLSAGDGLKEELNAEWGSYCLIIEPEEPHLADCVKYQDGLDHL